MELDPYDTVSMINTDVVIKTRANQETKLSKLLIPVPITLVPFRGRFCTVPEIVPKLLAKGYKPAVIATIDIEIPAKS